MRATKDRGHTKRKNVDQCCKTYPKMWSIWHHYTSLHELWADDETRTRSTTMARLRANHWTLHLHIPVPLARGKETQERAAPENKLAAECLNVLPLLTAPGHNPLLKDPVYWHNLWAKVPTSWHSARRPTNGTISVPGAWLSRLQCQATGRIWGDMDNIVQTKCRALRLEHKPKEPESTRPTSTNWKPPHIAAPPGLEPRITEPESVVLPITPKGKSFTHTLSDSSISWPWWCALYWRIFSSRTWRRMRTFASNSLRFCGDMFSSISFKV